MLSSKHVDRVQRLLQHLLPVDPPHQTPVVAADCSLCFVGVAHAGELDDLTGRTARQHLALFEQGVRFQRSLTAVVSDVCRMAALVPTDSGTHSVVATAVSLEDLQGLFHEVSPQEGALVWYWSGHGKVAHKKSSPPHLMLCLAEQDSKAAQSTQGAKEVPVPLAQVVRMVCSHFPFLPT